MHLAVGVPLPTAGMVAPASFFLGQRDHENALFTLELERMMSPIHDAVDVALTYPNQYSALYHFMVTGADQSDVAGWLAQAAIPRLLSEMVTGTSWNLAQRFEVGT
ncbi:MAG: hypothetical protein ACT4P0_13910 [Panacagrimonas sp.]